MDWQAVPNLKHTSLLPALNIASTPLGPTEPEPVSTLFYRIEELNLEAQIEEIMAHMNRTANSVFVGEAAGEMPGAAIHVQRMGKKFYGWTQSREMCSHKATYPFVTSTILETRYPVGIGIEKFEVERDNLLRMLKNMLVDGTMPKRFVKMYAYPGHFIVKQIRRNEVKVTKPHDELCVNPVTHLQGPEENLPIPQFNEYRYDYSIYQPSLRSTVTSVEN